MNNENKRVLINTLLLIPFLMMLFILLFGTGGTQKTTYSDFIKQVDEGKVASVVINGEMLIVTNTEGEQYEVAKFEDEELTKRLVAHDIEFESSPKSNVDSFRILLNLTEIAFFIMLIVIMYKQYRMSMGSSPNDSDMVKKVTQPTVLFKDVAGIDEAKESLEDIVDFLHNPSKYTNLGARLPKGVLLVGPPGTGKTLLAKAIAGEAKVPFYPMSGSDFVEKFVGVGASRVRTLFKKAIKNAPCIIFIDEIDAIGKARNTIDGNSERAQTLNQLLSEMDGFDSSAGIIIIGATNCPETLDKALLRAGRFDRQVIVNTPDLEGRAKILKLHAAKVPLSDDVDFEKIAMATAGASGADLENVVNEAAIETAKCGLKAVTQEILLKSIETTLVGKEKKAKILSDKEKRIVAYHEIGHAVVAATQKHTEPIQKITIVPRTTGALGFVMQVPEEEKFLYSKDELLNQIVTLMGGRAAENIFFHIETTGASNDISKATSIARSMITTYGMSDALGMVSLTSQQLRYLDGKQTLNCGEAMESKVDDEIMKLLKNSFDQAHQILESQKEKVEELAEYLIQKETITGEEFMKIFCGN